MAKRELNRRRFNHLTAAAMGGIAIGATLGCQGDGGGGGGGETTAQAAEMHLCRGLNSCKGNGAGGANACAGQGKCATVEHHGCAGENTCKGLGGCGETPAENECKGHGGCNVPLMEDAWEKVRAKFEEKMKAAGKEFGDAPPSDA